MGSMQEQALLSYSCEVITITEDKKPENNSTEESKSPSIQITPSDADSDGKFYFDILRDGGKVGEIVISKYEEEQDGENVTIIKAKLISKILKDQGSRSIECTIR